MESAHWYLSGAWVVDALAVYQVGEFTGGIIQRNASTGEETMNFIEYYSVDSAGKFWGLFKPIVRAHSRAC
jgi:hypothetical protein